MEQQSFRICISYIHFVNTQADLRLCASLHCYPSFDFDFRSSSCRQELFDVHLAAEFYKSHSESLQALFEFDREAAAMRLAAAQRRGWAEIGELGARRERLRPAADSATRGRSTACRVLRVFAERGRTVAGSGHVWGSTHGRSATSQRSADDGGQRGGAGEGRAWVHWGAEWEVRVVARLAAVEGWASGLGDELRAENRTRRADCLRCWGMRWGSGFYVGKEDLEAMNAESVTNFSTKKFRTT
jgi:hypothetical protein